MYPRQRSIVLGTRIAAGSKRKRDDVGHREVADLSNTNKREGGKTYTHSRRKETGRRKLLPKINQSINTEDTRCYVCRMKLYVEALSALLQRCPWMGKLGRTSVTRQKVWRGHAIFQRLALVAFTGGARENPGARLMNQRRIRAPGTECNSTRPGKG